MNLAYFTRTEERNATRDLHDSIEGFERIIINAKGRVLTIEDNVPYIARFWDKGGFIIDELHEHENSDKSGSVINLRQGEGEPGCYQILEARALFPRNLSEKEKQMLIGNKMRYQQVTSICISDNHASTKNPRVLKGDWSIIPLEGSEEGVRLQADVYWC